MKSRVRQSERNEAHQFHVPGFLRVPVSHGEKEGYVANGVVGNYNVVVQVSLTAIDRFLAVMHECQRFLHSTSGYVNDVPPPQPHLPPIVFTGVETPWAAPSPVSD